MPDLQLSPELAVWLERFRVEHGRAPRLLHIGNVGNNGYNNAKLLNRAGLDCDVACFDYYHIMGCPEWEDADFHGDIRSEFYPTWEGVDLQGFERPRWFAQGPTTTCIDYLVARRSRQEHAADALWDRLRMERERECARLRGEIISESRWARFAPLAKKALRKFWKLPYIVAIRTPIGRRVYWAITGGPFRRASRRLVDRFAELFPDRPDRLLPADIQDYGLIYPQWARLFHHYDLVVGYATNGIFPMLVGGIPYIAYEHGTIRNLPFEQSAQGRLCALIYRLADVAFITNCDNNQAAERLKLSNYKWVPHPINEDRHATTDPTRIRREICAALDSEFIVFHPSRHHWDAKRDTSWDKGNDILIEGFARFVKNVCPKAGAVFVEWGQTLGPTRELLAKYGIERNVLWIAPQPTPRMNAYIQAADVLADQFCIGTFGGIMPKGLLFGTPNLIYLDEALHRWCLPELPPIMNTRTADEVCAALTRLYQDRSFAGQLADAGQAWYAKYHGRRVVADAFTDAVRQFVRPNAENPS